MSRPTRALIDLPSLRHNYQQARNLAPNALSMAVVKADGYGHGLVTVARALADLAPRFAVACREEADTLRAAGLNQPVVLLEGVHAAADYGVCRAQGYIPFVHHQSQLDWLAAIADQRPLRVWVKVNTGMNRLGFAPDEVAAVVARLTALGNVTVEGLATHFAQADAPDLVPTQRQVAVMNRLVAECPGLGLSLSNSAGHLAGLTLVEQWTRPGIMLYGSTPLLHRTAEQLGLQPAMTLESALISVRALAPGDEVGYGATWRATHAGRMGVVAIGYGDGYPRHAPSGTPVWVRGTRAPLIGRVSMDMLAVDLSHLPQAEVGDRVELWGANVSVDEVAGLAGTIGYELLTGLTPRVPRVITRG
ncbi:MAG: alanine racemase [Marinobacter sp.]|nr:alanine racemase [Marinobacter sp.]